MTWKFVFQSKYIFYEIANTILTFPSLDIYFLEIPFNKENCSPACFLLIEGYVQNLLAYSYPILLHVNQDSFIRFFNEYN